MSINKMLNNPESGLDEEFVDFVNNHSAALADGDVVVIDASVITSTSQKQGATVTTTNYSDQILGVVHDPLGKGVGVGERGVAMIKGYKRVKYGTGAVTAGTTVALYHSGTALTAKKATAGATILPGACIGNIVGSKTTAQTTVPCYVRVR